MRSVCVCVCVPSLQPQGIICIMAPKKNPASAGSEKSYSLSGKRTFRINVFNDKGYIHFRDNYNGKTFSLSEDELSKLVKRSSKIMNKFVNLKKKSIEKENKKSSKNKNEEAMNASDEDASDMTSEEED